MPSFRCFKGGKRSLRATSVGTSAGLHRMVGRTGPSEGPTEVLQPPFPDRASGNGQAVWPRDSEQAPPENKYRALPLHQLVRLNTYVTRFRLQRLLPRRVLNISLHTNYAQIDVKMVHA
jgi:hypothetical protein